MPQILDGNATAAAIKEELKERVEALKAKGITPGLGTVLVGDDPASAPTWALSTATAQRSVLTPSVWTCPVTSLRKSSTQRSTS